MSKKHITIPLIAAMGLSMIPANQVLAVPNDTKQVVSEETKESNHIAKQSIKKMNATKYTISALNVRDKPSAKGKKIGSLPYGKKVIVTGRDSNTGWYRIKFRGGIGFVSGSYLSSKKPSAGSTSKPSTGKPSTSKPSNDDRYDTDCVVGADDWLSGKADCKELEEGESWW